MIVLQVIPRSQAKAMGVLRNDIIVSINGVPVVGIHEANTELRKLAASKATVKLELIRKGTRMKLVR